MDCSRYYTRDTLWYLRPCYSVGKRHSGTCTVGESEISSSSRLKGLRVRSSAGARITARNPESPAPVHSPHSVTCLGLLIYKSFLLALSMPSKNCFGFSRPPKLGHLALGRPPKFGVVCFFLGLLHAPEIGVSWLFPGHQICFGFLYAHLQIYVYFPGQSRGVHLFLCPWVL